MKTRRDQQPRPQVQAPDGWLWKTIAIKAGVDRATAPLAGCDKLTLFAMQIGNTFSNHNISAYYVGSL